MNFAPSQNAQAAMQYLISQGVPPHIAAGKLGNWAAESGTGINPGAYNPNENAIGIAQWTPSGGRRAAVEELARAGGMNFSTLQGQIDASLAEMQGPEARARERVYGATDPGSAAALYDQHYERSSGEHRQKRIDYANQIYAWYKEQGASEFMAEEAYQQALASTGTGAPQQGDIMGGGGATTMLGGAGSDQTGSSPSTEEEGGTLMDSIRGATFNPGVALQGLGAAIAAGSQGKSAAPELAEIRRRYQEQQNYLAEQAKEKMQNLAMRELFKDDPEMLAAIDGGLPIDAAMQLKTQQDQFRQQMAMQENQFNQENFAREDTQVFTSAESAKDRAATYKIRSEDREVDWARVAQAETQINNQVSQFAQTHGLAVDTLAQRTEQSALEYALEVDKYKTDTDFGRQAAELAGLKFEEQVRAAAVSEGFTGQGLDLATAEFEAKKDQFKQTYGMSVEQFELEKKKVENQVTQFNLGNKVDKERLASDIFYRNAQIDDMGIDNAREAEALKIKNAQVAAALAVEEKALQDAEAQNLINGKAGKAFIHNMAKTMGDSSMQAYIERMPDEAFADGEMLSQFRQAMAFPQSNMTGDMKEAVFLSDPQVPQQVKDNMMRLRDAARNIDDPMAKRQYEVFKTALDRDAKVMQDSAAKAAAAREGLRVYDEMAAIVARYPAGELPTGAFNELILPAKKILNDLGIPMANLSEQEILSALHAKVFPTNREEGSGSTSDWEGSIMALTEPSVADSEDAYRAKLDIGRRRVERDIAYQSYVETNYTGIEGQQLRDVNRGWQQLVDEGAPQTKPLFANLDTFTDENLANMNVAPGDVVYFNGRPEMVNSADHYAAMLEMRRRKGSK